MLQVMDEPTVFFFALHGIRMSENGRRMNGNEDRCGQRGRPCSTSHVIESNGLAEDRLGCSRAETDDDARLYNLYFGFQPRPAGGDFSGGRLFVFATLTLRFPFKVFHSIGDIEVPPVDSRFAQPFV